MFLYGFYASWELIITKTDIVIPGLDCNMKIVHISDLHLGPVYGREHVERIVSEIKRLNPDLVAITGDLMDGSMKLEPDTLKPFSQLKAKIYFALGNHDDVFLGIDEVKRALEHSNIVLLENEQAEFDKVNIIGIGYSISHSRLIREIDLKQIYPNKLNILLYHAPELSVDTLERYNINLFLSGHTHAGQIFPFYCDKWMSFQYVRGLHRSRNGNCYAHISEGTGTAGPRLRMFSRSTIALLNIHP